MTPEITEDFCVVGPAEAHVEKIRALEEAGFTQFSCHIRFGHEETLEEWADVIEGL